MYELDALDSTCFINVEFDGKGHKLTSSAYTSWSKPSICGGSSPDFPNVQVYGRDLHSISTLTFAISLTITQDSTLQSYGFREIMLQFATNTAVVTETIYAYPTIAYSSSGSCACTLTEYCSNSLICLSCSASCMACFGPSNAECYQCNSDYTFDGSACISNSPSTPTTPDTNQMQTNLNTVTNENKVLSPQLAKIVTASNIALISFMGTSFIGTLAIGATSSLWSIINCQQFIGNFLYFNINYPTQVEVLLETLNGASIWNILPNPLASLTAPLLNEVLNSDSNLNFDYKSPYKYDLYQLTSFFIQNGTIMMMTNITLLVILALLELLTKIKCFASNRIFMKVRSSFRWNIIARTFLENAIPLLQATFLQLRRLAFSGVYLISCSLLTVLSLVYGCVMLFYFLRVLYIKKNTELEDDRMIEVYGTLYEGMALKKNNGKYYHIIIMLRGVILVFMTVFTGNIVMIQLTIPMIFNAGLIYYLFAHAEFESRVMNFTNKLKEILILLGELAIFFLVAQKSSEDYYGILGWIVVGLLGAVVLIEIGYIAVLQIISMKIIWRKITDMCVCLSKIFGRSRHKVTKIRNESMYENSNISSNQFNF